MSDIKKAKLISRAALILVSVFAAIYFYKLVSSQATGKSNASGVLPIIMLVGSIGILAAIFGLKKRESGTVTKPTETSPAPAKDPMHSKKLHELAHTHRRMIFCIAGQILSTCIMLSMRSEDPQGHNGAWLPLMLLVALSLLCLWAASIIGGIYYGFKALKLLGHGLLARSFACVFMPTCIGLIIAHFISRSITSTLQSHGVRVGFLGADLTTLPKLDEAA